MNIIPTCIGCITKKAGDLYTEQHLPEEGRMDYMMDVLARVSQVERNLASPVYYQAMLTCLEDRTGHRDLYEKEKQHDNQMLLSMEEEIASRIAASADPIMTAAGFSLAGNYLDYTIVQNITKEKLLAMMEDMSSHGVDREQLNAFLADLKEAKTLLFTADNCGEIVLDKLFLKEIKKMFPHLTVKVMVRGGCAANDVTLKEAEEVGLAEIGEVLSSGVRMPGLEPRLASPEAQKELREADVILAKGLGNFESLSGHGYKHIYFLFLCKCQAVADLFGLDYMQEVFCREQDLPKQGA